MATEYCALLVIHVSATFDDYSGWKIRHLETLVYMSMPVCVCVRACVCVLAGRQPIVYLFNYMVDLGFHTTTRDSSRDGANKRRGWKNEGILDVLSYRYVETHVYPLGVLLFFLVGVFLFLYPWRLRPVEPKLV